MSRFFTQAQIDEIQQRLVTRTVRDSDFIDSDSLTGEEHVPILQEGMNKKMPLADFAEKVAEKAIIVGPGEFVLHDETGTDTTGGMTQRSITTELAKKMEIGDIVLYDETGNNTDGAMTQAAVTIALSDASVSEDKILEVLETLTTQEITSLLDL